MATPEPPNHDAQEFSYETSPHLYLFTSLTAGSSHIITATSRMETILKANRIPFYAIDTATDEKARRIWTRRAKGKKIPGLVKQGMVLADIEQVEEWNEFGEIKDVLLPKKKKTPVKSAASAAAATKKETKTPVQSSEAASATKEPPPAPPMPDSKEAQDLPIRTKPDTTPEPPVVTETVPKQKEPAAAKSKGQSSLASEVAAAAQKRARDKTAALKASMEAKRKENEKAGEVAEEKGATPEKAPVEEALDAGPAPSAGETAATDAKEEDEEITHKETHEEGHGEKEEDKDESTEETSIAASTGMSGAAGMAVIEREVDKADTGAAPASKSGEDAVTDTGKQPEKELSHKSEPAVSTKGEPTKESNGEEDKEEEEAEKEETGEGKEGTKAEKDAEKAKENSGVQPDRDPVEHALDAAPSVKSGVEAVTSNPEAQEGENAAAVHSETNDTTKITQDEETMGSEGPKKPSSNVAVPADEDLVKQVEDANTIPEEPEKGDAISKEEVGVHPKDSDKDAKEGAKATESVED